MAPRPAVENAHALPLSAVLARLAADPARGLFAAEARSRLARGGAQRTAVRPPVPPWRRLLAQFASPLVLLPLLATQILWVYLVTDSLPAHAVGVDPPDAGLMRRAARLA